MSTTGRSRVFLDVSIDGEPSGRLIIELFTDHTPRTCENFRQLCVGQYNNTSYAGTPFHRVIDEFMVQGGDITHGNGTGIVSIYGNEFEDENLDWREMDAEGLVCSANRGKNTNGSQFFIILEPQSYLNGKHTIFGRLVAGHDVLRKIASVSVDDDDRPKVPVIIARCGELERKRKRELDTPHNDESSRATGDVRGRWRESRDSHPEIHPSNTSVQAETKARRQSDNTIDEGIRGRPRKRSGQRADARIIDDDLSSDQHSSVRMHKRKRSPSPSRHTKPETRDGDRHHERRRRRSLPNQYDNAPDHDGDRHDHYHPRQGRKRDTQGLDRRENDRWRPYDGRENSSRYHDHYGDGRLGDDAHQDGAPPVKFKGRGVMKYREPDRF